MRQGSAATMERAATPRPPAGVDDTTPWPAGPRLLLGIPDHEVDFPIPIVAFPRIGLARIVLDGPEPSVPKGDAVSWEAWLAACGRSLEELPHGLTTFEDADRFFFRKWASSLREYARYGFKGKCGVLAHYMGMGHAMYDVGPYSGPHRWPGMEPVA